ncbi:MAG: hypothetical protein ACOZNI_29395 [Myxococcota bacterium]
MSLLTIFACASMEPSADIFAPADVEKPSAAAPQADDLDFPVEPPLVLTSEQMRAGDGAVGLATAAGVDVEAVVPDAEPALAAVAPAAPVAAPSPVGLPPVTRWPVRLVSTIPNAQPPRAILGLPSGEERVVSPGSMLAEEGLVVIAVTRDKVQLARIEPAGDHARIDSVEISAQYPVASTTP